MSHSLGSSLSTSFGGGERDRTDDPLLAKQVLSQLSYTPESELRNQSVLCHAPRDAFPDS
jgi:hypothetical protein